MLKANHAPNLITYYTISQPFFLANRHLTKYYTAQQVHKQSTIFFNELRSQSPRSRYIYTASEENFFYNSYYICDIFSVVTEIPLVH